MYFLEKILNILVGTSNEEMDELSAWNTWFAMDSCLHNFKTENSDEPLSKTWIMIAEKWSTNTINTIDLCCNIYEIILILVRIISFNYFR